MLRSEKVLKILLIGDGAVGKTALRHSFLGEGFQSNYMMTVGADFAIYKYDSDKHGPVKLQIWDLAGQSHFSSVRPPFYAGAHGVIFVYDVTNLDSLENAQDWLREALKFIGKPVPFGYLGNKIDLRKEGEKAHLSESRSAKILKKLHSDFKLDKYPIVFYETSAKTGKNVDESFIGITEMILDPSSVKEMIIEEEIPKPESKPKPAKKKSTKKSSGKKGKVKSPAKKEQTKKSVRKKAATKKKPVKKKSQRKKTRK